MCCTVHRKNEKRCFEALLDTLRLTTHLAGDLSEASVAKTVMIFPVPKNVLPPSGASVPSPSKASISGSSSSWTQNHEFMCCGKFRFSIFPHFPLPFCHKNQKGHQRILQFSDHQTGISIMIQTILAAVSPLPLLSVLLRQQPLLAPWNTPVHWKQEADLTVAPQKWDLEQHSFFQSDRSKVTGKWQKNKA